MKTTRFVFAFALGLGAIAAQAQSFSDTNGDGFFSIEELQAGFAPMTPDLFRQIDADGNGQIDADELQAARERGLIG